METKGDPPIQFIQDKKPNPIIEFYFELAQLKQLYRQGWLQRGVARQRCESVAEHSFSLTTLAMIVADHLFPELNTEKIMRMCLLHDIAEAYTGDFTPQHQITKTEKQHLEQQAMEQLLAKLARGAYYIELWQEYEEQQTPEAKFVKNMDRLDMILQASIYEYIYKKDLSEFMSAIEKINCPHIQKIFRDLCEIRESI
ncbi:HD family hydrolase [Candidatus Uabimicrobium sp. HlEnr_7]|uniref:HD domain-containing protein n=1 Tax=Candidatus Uabimicrobium helgolandensis TaxID=3095367 RepID=UPI003558BAA7